MYLAYRVNGIMIALCKLDKTKYYGYDIRAWFHIDGNRVCIDRKIDKNLETFELCNDDVNFEVVQKTMLQEL